MAKGQESKNIVAQKILATFENSFQYEKEIRIPVMENGEEVQKLVKLNNKSKTKMLIKEEKIDE